jgi:hypothetical protein
MNKTEYVAAVADASGMTKAQAALAVDACTAVVCLHKQICCHGCACLAADTAAVMYCLSYAKTLPKVIS